MRVSFINLRLRSRSARSISNILTKMFPGMLEPVAASYNGGEDNVARWLEALEAKRPGRVHSGSRI